MDKLREEEEIRLTSDIGGSKTAAAKTGLFEDMATRGTSLKGIQ